MQVDKTQVSIGFNRFILVLNSRQIFVGGKYTLKQVRIAGIRTDVLTGNSLLTGDAIRETRRYADSKHDSYGYMRHGCTSSYTGKLYRSQIDLF